MAHSQPHGTGHILIKTEENEIFVLHFFLVLGLLTSLKADKMSNYLVI